MARSLTETIERRRHESGAGGDRFVDMRLDFIETVVDEQGNSTDGEMLMSVGGIWDRRRRRYRTKNGKRLRCPTRIVIRCHPGQSIAVRWFKGWLNAHAKRRGQPPPPPPNWEEMPSDVDPSDVYSALFAGGRRAGKTWIGVALSIAYAVAFPRAIVWLIAPEEEDWAELQRYAKRILPRAFKQGQNRTGWRLINGSELMLKSAYDPESLKKGQVDLALLNEGQRCKERAFVVVRGGIVDRGGLVLVCANPPTEEKDQTWVADFAAEARVGERAAVYVEFNSLLNPHIDRRALLAMKHDVDERTFEIEVFGRFLGPKDAVAYNWNRLENERSVPDVGDVTEEFLRIVGEGEGIRQIVGIDVQTFPYMAAVVYRFYASTDVDKVQAWIVDEVALDGGDEVGLAAELYEKGYHPDETLLIVDASGTYQHSKRRSADSPPPEWNGKGSFDIFRSAREDGPGYRRIVSPDRRMKRKNPQIVDRMRAFTSLICTHAGVRRLYADPKRAPKTCKAIREWRVVNGKPSRVANVAHMGDAVSYPIVRIFPRRLRSAKPGSADPVTAKVDKPGTPRTDPRDVPQSMRASRPAPGRSPGVSRRLQGY